MSAIVPRNDKYGWTEAELEDDGTIKIQDFEDVSHILKMNENIRNNKEAVYFGDGTQTHARLLGTISPLQMQLLVEQGIFWDDDKLRKWFKDLDNYMWSVNRGMK